MEDEELVTSGIDMVCAKLDTAAITALAEAIRSASEEDEQKAILSAKVSECEGEAMKLERQRKLEAKQREEKRAAEVAARAAEEKKAAEFSDEELLLLGQALKRFPGGTLHRWAKVAEWVGHGRSTKEVIAQASALAQNIASGKSEAKSFQAAASQKFHAKAAGSTPKGRQGGSASPRQHSAAALLGAAAASGHDTTTGRPWLEEEQRAFEAALKKFPSSLKDKRWPQVAGV